MFSDFCHLINNVRNSVIQHSWFQTPYGIVKKRHWEDVLNMEKYDAPNLKIAHKLSLTHLNPIGYQKMKVSLTFEYFSRPVADAMEMLSKKNISLRDSMPSQRFILMIDALIRAMMSRTPLQALKYSQSEVCPERENVSRRHAGESCSSVILHFLSNIK
ncbi:uncharacterized protein LOC123294936 [Chrysoperla carnea]|uniref:uncharacterized protein LOC123294936 n=1 Tax=Chrysoperla carnea TaxID=189513 RepID=UPI001D0822AB|nr:uncharacterized protein LOC123294936 [Chrysoperla carnea]